MRTAMSADDMQAGRRGLDEAEAISGGRLVEPGNRAFARMVNTSGFVPLDLRVLVLPDPVEEKIGSIIKPDSVREQDEWAQTRATLIAVGDNAWEEAKARAPGFSPPRPGDRILFGKYHGQRLDGVDGRKYIIMNDEDVIARLSEEG